MGFWNLKAFHARHHEQPVKKPPCVVHPLNAPRTLQAGGYPSDFQLYEYAGAMIEQVSAHNAQGELLRRPAIVARMVRKDQANGAKFQQEMTVSAKDLYGFKDPITERKGHPNAKAISSALTSYYENKISPDLQEAPAGKFAENYLTPASAAKIAPEKAAARLDIAIPFA